MKEYNNKAAKNQLNFIEIIWMCVCCGKITCNKANIDGFFFIIVESSFNIRLGDEM